MLKFRSHLQNYASIADFEQSCLEKFEIIKKELTTILGVDCNIELSGFNPQFTIEPFYLESFHFSMTCYEYVMSFNGCSSTFDDIFIDLTKLCFVHLNKNFNLDSIELQHTDMGKSSDEHRAFSGIRIVYSIPETSANIIVKHSADVSHGRDGILMEEFNRHGTLISVVDEATSILHKFKKAASKADVQLESIR